MIPVSANAMDRCGLITIAGQVSIAGIVLPMVGVTSFALRDKSYKVTLKTFSIDALKMLANALVWEASSMVAVLDQLTRLKLAVTLDPTLLYLADANVRASCILDLNALRPFTAQNMLNLEQTMKGVTFSAPNEKGFTWTL